MHGEGRKWMFMTGSELGGRRVHVYDGECIWKGVEYMCMTGSAWEGRRVHKEGVSGEGNPRE